MLSKSVGADFSNSIWSLPVCVKYCGNSHNILNFFIIIILLLVICDHDIIAKNYDSLKAQIMVATF